MRVNPNPPARRLPPVWLVAAMMLLGLATAAAAEKQIRLRNAAITTQPPDPAAVQKQGVDGPVSGLYLIQFRERFQPAWAEDLRALNVNLLRYVPDDAFVARLNQTHLGQVQKLPFVQWAGEYRPSYKLQGILGHLPPTNRFVGIRILLSPDATAADLTSVKGSLLKLNGEVKTGFGNILAGDTTPAQLDALSKSAAVLWMEPARKMKLYDEVATKIVAGGDVDGQNHQADVHALGYDGRGVIVSVADSGLYNGDDGTMHPDLEGRVDGFFFYNGLEDASDEHSHGTHVTGIIAGDGATGETDDNGALYGLGVAPKAHIIAQRVFDGEGNDYLPEPDVLTRDAVRSGAVIGSNSWGDDSFGRYDLFAAQFDALVRDADPVTPGEQPYILEFSAGNSGPGAQTIGTPALAKNVIATGACENNRFDLFIYSEGQETMADFSSRGPCEDGRIKPDIVAPGTWIASLQSASAGDENAWLAISPNYQYQGGTSQAGPHVSGCAAIFVQYYRQNFGGATPSPALVKAALIQSAVDMGIGEITIPGDDEEDPTVLTVGDTGPVPNMDEGWGRVDMTELIGASHVTEYLDQTHSLSSGQVYEQKVLVGSRNEPFKITLAYTDVPALPATIPALVNDLDLEVISPDGDLYRGNQFFAGESVAGVPVGDSINNVEGFFVSEPSPGEWTVRVRARNVVEDIHHRTGIAPEQDFALVISADLPPSGSGVIFFDRVAYPAPAIAKLTLIDLDLATQPTVTVRLTSTADSLGENLTLRTAGSPGTFTNSISLTTSAAVANDGKLQVANDATIAATYQDASPPLERKAVAKVDNQPPVISGVLSTNRFGRTTIEWTTDESSTSLIFFGPSGSLSLSRTNSALVESHSLTLPPLPADQTNFYYVVSTDAAGNTSTNDNNGRYYSFVTQAAKPILLVYAEDDLFELPGIDTYTTALDQLGVEYETWDLAERPSPTAQDLKPFRVVMWRPQELSFAGETLTPPMQAAITEYVTNGGSLFMSSMELCSRLTTPSDLAFRQNILHVADFSEDAGAISVTGVTGDVISDGLQIDLDYSTYPDLFGFVVFEDLPDHLSVSTNAAAIFREADSGQAVGLRYPKTGQDSNGRVVFLSFALEAVPDFADAPNNRASLLGNVLKFLAPDIQGSSSVAFDGAAYTVPASATIEVTDVRRSGARQLTATISSATDSAPQTITLNETVRPGVFRTSITLVAPGTPVATGQIRVKQDDTLTAIYLDPSANREIRTTALIDTVPAQISGVQSEPEYNEAVVSWQTSKLTDALVRFGESDGDPSFLSRTAYSSEFAQDHSVQITGLLPDRDYYFQVISRDEAGNVSVSGQQGTLYHFRTLKPIPTPWSDDLESGKNGWVVFNDDQAVDDETGNSLLDAGWQYGIPSNDLTQTGHSGTHVWATNLRNDPATIAISDLVSPAIELQSGNKATLRFWQMYDFVDRSEFLDLQLGLVAITTNNGAYWETIYTPSDELVADWEPVEVDLSRFVGKVVRLGWHYELFSFDVDYHPGWVIDDISITTTNSPIGNFRVTNNISQAAFTITGPASYSGSGVSLVVTNAPPGQYQITWTPVPYYTTPAPQTSTLSTNGPLVFTGQYTFSDANTNGISDAWEQSFFGNVSPQRTSLTDTDGDGATDYMEFYSGTDPTDPASKLALSLPTINGNRTVQFNWTAVPGYSYRLEGSTDATLWLPFSDWFRATNTAGSTTLPPLDQRFPYMFRLQVQP